MDREKAIKGLNDIGGFIAGRIGFEQARNFLRTIDDVVELLKEQEDLETELTNAVELIHKKNERIEKLLKEQEKKQITVHKKHVITWSRNDEFSMRKLYDAICETLLDEGELFIARTDDHEKVDFVFYVEEGR